jgi:tripartite ATP-independent transporter DctM subunit
MEWWLILSVIIALLLALFLTGIHVAIAFMFLNIIGFYVWVGGLESLKLLVPSAFEGIAHFTLVTVPLFILMGEVLFHTGLAKMLIDNLAKWVGRVPGSLSLLSIGGGTLFAMMCGSAVSGVAVFGSTLGPEMRKRGYADSMIYPSILGAGSLATVIPPSILIVLIATLSRQSVGDMLLGGIIPGFILAAFYFVYFVARARFQPHLAPPIEGHRASLAERMRALLVIAPLSLLIFLVLGVIFVGVATPSEAAALGASGAVILAAAYGMITWNGLKKALMSSISVTAMILMIVMSASAFGQLLAFTGVARSLVEVATALPVAPIVIVMIMQLILLVMGMVMEDISILLISIPLFFPIILSLGVDPLWFGILMLINMEIAIVSPPFGLLLFTLKGVTPEASMADIYRSAIPVCLIILALLVLLMIFPDLATWLPRQAYK